MGNFYFNNLSKIFISTLPNPKVWGLVSSWLIKDYTDEDFCKVI